jgi:hypothetical protein
LWVERVDKTYRDRAPRLVENPRDPSGAYFSYEGYPLHPIGIGLAAGKSPEELAQFLTRGTYADARPGGWDPAERLKDNELDGVEADVLYTTLGFRLFWLKDAALQEECFRVYNDWLAAYCGYAPKRMAGLAMIGLYDPKAGARELERCAKLGLKGAMIWCSPPSDRPYSADRYDPFWAAAQALRMPISLHSITGMGRESQWDFGDRYMRATVLSHEVERSFSVLIFSGVLDRFPELQVVSAENNCGWLPYYLQRMDRHVRARSLRRRVQDRAEAERGFPAPDASHLHRRLRRRRQPPLHRRGPDDVVLRLPPPGLVVAPLARGGRARLQGRQPGRPAQDHAWQRRPPLRLRAVSRADRHAGPGDELLLSSPRRRLNEKRRGQSTSRRGGPTLGL